MERTYKVLPFETKQGKVLGHEVKVTEFCGQYVDRIEFETWDDQAEMMVGAVVHWTKSTEFMKKTWPSGGTVKAVFMDNGTRHYAEARYSAHQEGGYDRAPLIARDAFAIVCGGSYVWEVVGMRAWIYSARDNAATEKYLSCPWERDNKAFQQRQPRIAA